MRSLAVVQPAKRVSGVVTVPGDKSISHRYAILAALAEGTSRLRHFSSARDCASTLACLAALGASVECTPDAVVIEGRGLGGWRPPAVELDAGNSGTTMRLLAGALAGHPFRSVLTGDASLRRRPMERIVLPLQEMGARIATATGGRAPLRIEGGQLRGICHQPPIPSAQVKSCVLLAGLLAEGRTTVVEPVPTRDHTERALRHFGASVETEGNRITVLGGRPLRAVSVTIPGDFSSAMFLIAAALILPGSTLVVREVGVNPTRVAALHLLAEWGAAVHLHLRASDAWEPVADIEVISSRLRGGKIAGPQVAALIDELPIVAALAPYTEQGVEIRDAAELRVKESDRIEALADNLSRMGAQVRVFPDGLAVAGSTPLRGARIDPRGDHRIAMAFAVAALRAGSPTEIAQADCVAVSFPGFFELLEQIAER